MIKKYLLGLLTMSLGLSGCTAADSVLGRTKTAPDEFQVVIRPPLTLPPSFSLEAIDKIEAPLSTDAVSTTDETITNQARVSVTGFDAVFGTDEIIPNIRNRIDEETLGVQIERRLPYQILFGGKPDVGPVLEPNAEAKRVHEALEAGEDLGGTPTPAIDPISGEPIGVE